MYNENSINLQCHMRDSLWGNSHINLRMSTLTAFAVGVVVAMIQAKMELGMLFRSYWE